MEFSRKRLAALGAGVVALMVMSIYLSFVVDDGRPLQEQTRAEVAFQDAGALRVGNQVRMNQKAVGRISDIALRGEQAVVTLEIDGDASVYRDATAQVLSRSGLGQVYVDLRPGDARAGELGDAVLPVGRTKSYTQVLDLVTELDRPTMKQATSALRELGGGAAGHGPDLHRFFGAAPEMLPDLGTVATTLSNDEGEALVSMLGSMDRLSARFEGREQEISNLTVQLDRTLGAVAVDDGQAVRDSLRAAPGAESELRTGLARLDRPLSDADAAMRRLARGSNALGEATPDLRATLRESLQPLGRVQSFARSARPAVDALSGVMRDARPLAPQLRRALSTAQVPLTVLAPYAPEVAKWFSFATSALGDGDQAGHWLRFTLIPATDSVSGNLPFADPLTNTDTYPEPGESLTPRAPQLLSGLLGGGDR